MFIIINLKLQIFSNWCADIVSYGRNTCTSIIAEMFYTPAEITELVGKYSTLYYTSALNVF